jgi:hypothetical protein
MPTFPSLTFAILLHVSVSQMDSSPALYVIENVRSDRGVVEIRNLVRLSIDRENKVVRETLLSQDQRFFGHFGGHRIALGRFIVTRYGGIIDIQAKKVIHDEQDGEVLGLEDGKVVYRINNSFRSSGLFSFDLKELKVATVKEGEHWDLPGVKSPDETMSIETKFDGVIRLHRLGKAPKELAKVRITFSKFASAFLGEAPCLWLDGERILAGQTNRKLIILTTQGAVEGPIEIKDAPAEVLSPPHLWRDPQGKVIYSCGSEDFLIDVPHRVASPLKRYSLGHGFEASVAVDEECRRSVVYDGKAIGQWTFSPHEALTAPGLLAFPYVRPSENANLGYPDGIAVWNARAGDWQTIKMWVNDLIGWSR